MSRELTDVQCYFISLVDRPANRRPFLIVKSDKTDISRYITAEAWDELRKHTRPQIEQIVKQITTARKHQVFKSANRPFTLWEVEKAEKALNFSKAVTFKGCL